MFSRLKKINYWLLGTILFSSLGVAGPESTYQINLDALKQHGEWSFEPSVAGNKAFGKSLEDYQKAKAADPKAVANLSFTSEIPAVFFHDLMAETMQAVKKGGALTGVLTQFSGDGEVESFFIASIGQVGFDVLPVKNADGDDAYQVYLQVNALDKRK